MEAWDTEREKGFEVGGSRELGGGKGFKQFSGKSRYSQTDGGRRGQTEVDGARTKRRERTVLPRGTCTEKAGGGLGGVCVSVCVRGRGRGGKDADR